MFKGQTMQVTMLEQGIVDLQLQRQDQGVNILGALALQELQEALVSIEQSKAKALLIRSGSDDFIVGADIKEFIPMFAGSEETLVANLLQTHGIFNRLEDLNIPTLAAIDGHCLGGGLELALCCDFRLATTNAKLGLPETRLGIFPGFGGTVRLSRLIGVDNAVEWIAGGKEQKSSKALADGVIQAVCSQEDLLSSAQAMLTDAIRGRLHYQRQRAIKQAPLQLSMHEQMMAFETTKAVVYKQAGRHYPAPMAAIQAMQKHAGLSRDKALQVEARAFCKVAKSPEARSLIGLFLADQKLKKLAKHHSQDQESIEQLGVLGAGIMGGGIAAQAALKGLRAHMKDVQLSGLEQGQKEAAGIYERRHARGRMTTTELTAALGRIWPTLSYEPFAELDLVVEAVVENPKVKVQVLAELEARLSSDAVIASNTSTIPIDYMAKNMAHPERFAGLHFFNPVHRMPLVEIIRGSKTNEATIGRLVKLALQMGKQPVVVNDGPGFLVNRVLFPYFAGFLSLVAQGVALSRVDRVMTNFGWPMGPAHLLDVVGLDTAVHASAVMAQAFPDRMQTAEHTALGLLQQAGRLGVKSGQGFWQYILDAKGQPKPLADPKVEELLAPLVGASGDPGIDLSDEDIVLRLMIPMAFETLRCLDEKIVASAEEADMALVLGIGFPPFLGGICHWMDCQGMGKLLEKAKTFVQQSPIYQAPATATSQRKFYPY